MLGPVTVLGLDQTYHGLPLNWTGLILAAYKKLNEVKDAPTFVLVPIEAGGGGIHVVADFKKMTFGHQAMKINSS